MKKYTVIILASVLFIIFSYMMPSEVSGHKSYQFGNVTIEAGWVNEPPLVGLLNEIEVIISKTDGNTPIRNALSTMDVSVVYGGIDKIFDFEASAETTGVYVSPIIPSQLGKYDLKFKGKILDEEIDTVIPIEDVESINKIAFPLNTVTSTGGSSNAINMDSTGSPDGRELSPVDSVVFEQVTKEINNIKQAQSQQENQITLVSNETLSVLENVTQKLNQLESNNNTTYLVSSIAIGFGMAGIILGVFLNRRTK